MAESTRLGPGEVNVVVAPDVVMRPIEELKTFVNQSLPSGPVVIDVGPSPRAQKVVTVPIGAAPASGTGASTAAPTTAATASTANREPLPRVTRGSLGLSRTLRKGSRYSTSYGYVWTKMSDSLLVSSGARLVESEVYTTVAPSPDKD